MRNSLSRPANGKSGGDHTRRAYHGIRNLMLHNELTPGQKFSYRGEARRPSLLRRTWCTPHFSGLARRILNASRTPQAPVQQGNDLKTNLVMKI